MNSKGFTLMEIIITSVILLLLLTAIINASVQMRGAFHATEVSARLQEDARLAINAMTTDLRKTSRSQVAITQGFPVDGSDRIRFGLPVDSDGDGAPDISFGSIVWGSNIVIIELQMTDGRGRLVKMEGPDTTVLAENVKKVNFVDFNIDSSLYLDELKVILELEETDGTGRTYNRTFTSVVNMRN